MHQAAAGREAAFPDMKHPLPIHCSHQAAEEGRQPPTEETQEIFSASLAIAHQKYGWAWSAWVARASQLGLLKRFRDAWPPSSRSCR